MVAARRRSAPRGYPAGASGGRGAGASFERMDFIGTLVTLRPFLTVSHRVIGNYGRARFWVQARRSSRSASVWSDLILHSNSYRVQRSADRARRREEVGKYGRLLTSEYKS